MTRRRSGSDGLRRSMQVGGDPVTRYVVDGQNVVQELRNGSAVATYGMGPRGLEYRQDSTGTRWYIYDGLGSVIAEVDGNNTNADGSAVVTATREYDVYGAPRSSTGMSTSSHKFVGGLGHTEDPTGLTYMRARYYDPAVGRFISEDPGKNGRNWYEYCNDDPVNRVDPTGKAVEIAIGVLILGTVLAGVLAAVAYYSFLAGYYTVTEANEWRGAPDPHGMTTGEGALSTVLIAMVSEVAGCLAVLGTLAGDPAAIPIAVIVVAAYGYLLGATFAAYNTDEPNPAGT